MIITRVVLNEAELDRRVKAVARKLAPDVVRIRYSMTLDSTGDEAIFFRVLLSDQASRERRLAKATERIEAELYKAIPFDEFGVHLYFDYRSRSEQVVLKERSWS